MYWNIAAIGILFLAIYIIIDIIKNKHRNIIKRVVIYSFIGYGINVLNVTLGMITLQPEPIAFNFHRYLQLKPFLFLIEWIGMYYNNGMDWFFWNSVKLSYYNFILLFPLGVYLSFFNVKNMKKAACIIFLVTFIIEALQLALSYGGFLWLHRTFNVDDLLLNTAGGVLGYFSFELFKNIYRKYKSFRSKQYE